MTETQYDPVKDAFVKKIPAGDSPDAALKRKRSESPQKAPKLVGDLPAQAQSGASHAVSSPAELAIGAGAAERIPISVSKLGKMKKRDPAAMTSKAQARDPIPRSRTPGQERPDRPPNDDAHNRPETLSTRDTVWQRAREPEHKREASENEQPAKRQKRPGARRDPEEAERERLETIRRQEESDRKAREAANLRNQYHKGSEVVRSHYNARPNQGREQRNQSPIVKLRNFNNWIKSTLIRMFTPPEHDSHIRVLDLGCGKGGDLMKWDKANISSYTGIDLAEISIEQARGRYRQMSRARFDADFYAFDCFRLPLTHILPPDRRKFDIVSMQFCLHYAFESEAKVRQMLSNVANSLPRGGKFIGTIPSSDAIISHIEKLPKGGKEWGNDIYRVEFENEPPPGPDVVFRPPFGHKYTFYLKDAVDIVPEYVVPFLAFRALAEEYNLELLYHKGFHEVFEEFCEDFDAGNLLDRMNVVKRDGSRGIEGDEKEACGFYLAFCFEKRGAK